MEDQVLDFRLQFQSTAATEIAALEDQFASAAAKMEKSVEQIANAIERMDGFAAVTREAIHSLQADLGGMEDASAKATVALTRSVADARKAIESGVDATGSMMAQMPNGKIQLDATEAGKQLQKQMTADRMLGLPEAIDMVIDHLGQLEKNTYFSTQRAAVFGGLMAATPALVKALGKIDRTPMDDLMDRAKLGGGITEKDIRKGFLDSLTLFDKKKKGTDFLGGVSKDMKAGSHGLASSLGSLIDKVTAPFKSIQGLLAIFGLFTLFSKIFEPFMTIMTDFLEIITTPLQQGLTEVAQELAPVMESLADGMSDLVDQWLPPFVALMKDGVVPTFLALIEVLKPAAEWIMETGKWLADWALQALQGKKGAEALYGAIAVLLIPVALALGAAISALWSLVAGFFTFLLANPIGLIVLAIVGVIYLLKEWAGGWENLWEGTKLFFGNVWDIMSSFGQAIWSMAKTIGSVIETVFSTLWTIVGGYIGLMMDLWSNTIGRIAGFFFPDFKKAMDKARSYLPGGGGGKVAIEVAQPKTVSVTETAETQEAKSRMGWLTGFMGLDKKASDKMVEAAQSEKEGRAPEPPRLVRTPSPSTEPVETGRVAGDAAAEQQVRTIGKAARPIMDVLEQIDDRMQEVARMIVKKRAEARFPNVMGRLAAFEA